ncbi:hypothetical protein AZI85_08365 [Bdellovibrio bacteriovorus]|uniref:Cell wall surface anchor family protein n=1 Tax=Bdellovibrio bacteriovorus TaxID=959 RepID=A0A150WGU6_BDEBC|nr:hypothetical protein [Bdellovibrio bacteriovorus]KYG62194.1 hypothetical protein AZI85_08365 [Bdellovibrio bacteriovorus]
MKILNVSVFFMSLVGTATTFAVPGSLTYQGRIKNSDGLPLEVNGVRFEFSITNPSGSCVLYKEISSAIDMRNSSGVFDVPIGTGTKNYPVDPGFKLLNAFNNAVTLNCEGGGTYVPIADDKRLLRVQFYDGTGWKLISPDSEIRSVPFAGHAQYAETAQKLGSNTVADFILKSSVPLCGAGEYLRHIAPAGTFQCTVPVVNGNDVSGNISGSSAGFTGNLSGDVSGTQSATSVDKIKGVAVNMTGLASGKVLKYNGTNWAPADDTDTNTDDKIRGVDVSATTPVSGQVLVHNGSAWAPQYFGMGQLRSTVTGTAQVPASCSTADKTLTWNSITDSFACTTIAIANTQVTGLGTAATKNFGTSSGNLVELDGTGRIPASLLPASSGNILDGGNSTGATVNVGTNDGQALSFETNNSARMTITSAGDIGIGTASPGYRLQVNKTSNATAAGNIAASFNFMWAAPTSSSASTFVGQYNGAESDGTSAAITGGILAQINYTHHNGSNALDKLVASWSGTYNKSSATVGSSLAVQGEVNNDASGIISQAIGLHSRVRNNGSGSITNAYGVYVDGVQGTNKWSIYTNDPTVPSYFAGYVGIGTNSPTAPLDVVGGSAYFTRSQNDAWGSNFVVRKDRAGAIVQNADEVGYVNFAAHDGSTYRTGASIAALVDGVPGLNDMPTRLIFATTSDGFNAPVERMRITSGGNVGIGTTNPTERLDLGGGNIKIGHEIVSVAQPAGAAVGWYFASCPAGKYVTGGACTSGSGSMVLNSDLTQTTYGCYKPDTSSNIVVKAICMNVR